MSRVPLSAEQIERKQKWQQEQHQLLSLPIVHRWSITTYGGKTGRKARVFIALAVLLIACMIGAGFYWGTPYRDATALWIMGGIGFCMSLFMRYLVMADNEYHYHLTQKGIYYTAQHVIPEMAYKIVRGSAWVGIPVCLVASIVVGPLIFAGAGAFGLLALKMSRFQSEIHESFIYFVDQYRVYHIKNDERITLVNHPFRVSNGGTIYCAQEQKEKFLSLLQQQIKQSSIIEVSRAKEIDYHTPFID